MRAGDGGSRFNWRRFVVLAATFAGAGLPVTGFGIHLAHGGPPAGAVQALFIAHNLLAMLFLAAGIWHVGLNWKGFRNAFAARTGRAPISRECAVAAGVVGLAWMLAILHGG